MTASWSSTVGSGATRSVFAAPAGRAAYPSCAEARLARIGIAFLSVLHVLLLRDHVKLIRAFEKWREP